MVDPPLLVQPELEGSQTEIYQCRVHLQRQQDVADSPEERTAFTAPTYQTARKIKRKVKLPKE